jgi:hypothetical protein
MLKAVALDLLEVEMAFHTTSINRLNMVSESDPDFTDKASTQGFKAAQIANRKPMSEGAAREEMDKLANAKDERAKYKIEITYLESRRIGAPSACSVAVWESGKRFHGGGDQSMFWCVNSKNNDEGCGGIIPDSMVRGGMALCPHCKKMVNQSFLPVERVGVFTPPNLAKEIERLFRHMNSDADLYLKFHRTDAAGMTNTRAEGRKTSEAVIYTLKSIMRDILGGSDLIKRIEAFLTA